MAGFNEILAGRFNRALQKYLSMKGPVPSPQLAPEFLSTFPFELTPGEFYLQDWFSFGQSTQQAAVAAIASAIRFRNPAASGALILFESLVLSLSGGTGDTVFLDYGTIAADLNTAVATGNQLDSRQKMGSGQIGSLVISRTASVAATGLQAVDVASVGNVAPFNFVVHRNAAIPLLPGDALQVRMNTVNLALAVGARWRQRALEDSEKT